MWQLAIEATNASSGSTAAALDHGSGTTDGDDEPGTVAPPSNDQTCSREYLPRVKSACGTAVDHVIVARCSAMREPYRKSASYVPAAIHPGLAGVALAS